MDKRQGNDKEKVNAAETKAAENGNVIHSDDHIEVVVLDEPGAGGACHKYSIVKKEIDPEKGGQKELGYINFQKGGIVLHGVNGLTNEALLAIVIHRFSCRENAIAKTHIETGLL